MAVTELPFDLRIGRVFLKLVTTQRCGSDILLGLSEGYLFKPCSDAVDSNPVGHSLTEMFFRDE